MNRSRVGAITFVGTGARQAYFVYNRHRYAGVVSLRNGTWVGRALLPDGELGDVIHSPNRQGAAEEVARQAGAK